MLPTTYRGDATINGERMSAELELDTDNLRLKVAEGQEVLNWPLRSLDVESSRNGDYKVYLGEESFDFAPAVDDGLGEEIALRRRFSPVIVDRPVVVTPVTAPVSNTVADRVRAAGQAPAPRTKKRRRPKFGGENTRYALFGLGAVTMVVVLVAIMTALFNPPDQADVTPEPEAPVSSAPQVPTPEVEVPPVTAEAVDPTVATTLPPETTAPPVPTSVAVFDATPEELAAAWDARAAAVFGPLRSSNLTIGDDNTFRMSFGDFVRLTGDTGSDGFIDRLTFLGDPSGWVQDDREVLTALGITVAVVEPILPPEGRAQLLDALGLDLEDLALAGLDGDLIYRGKTYELRWDSEIDRIVFEVTPDTSAS